MKTARYSFLENAPAVGRAWLLTCGIMAYDEQQRSIVSVWEFSCGDCIVAAADSHV